MAEGIKTNISPSKNKKLKIEIYKPECNVLAFLHIRRKNFNEKKKI